MAGSLLAQPRARQLGLALWLVIAGAVLARLADPFAAILGLVGLAVALAVAYGPGHRYSRAGAGMSVGLAAGAIAALGGSDAASCVTLSVVVAIAVLAVVFGAPPTAHGGDVDDDRRTGPAPAHLRLPPGVASPELFERLACHELTRARRYERPLTQLLIGIEGWAEIERVRGRRGAGDLVAALATRARRVLRDVDALGIREAGQIEVLLPETPVDGALVVAGRIERAALDDLGIQVRVGAASFPDDGGTVEALRREAEAALDLATLERVEVVERTRLG